MWINLAGIVTTGSFIEAKTFLFMCCHETMQQKSATQRSPPRRTKAGNKKKAIHTEWPWNNFLIGYCFVSSNWKN